MKLQYLMNIKFIWLVKFRTQYQMSLEIMTRMIPIKNDPQENNLNVFTPPYFSYITLPTKPPLRNEPKVNTSNKYLGLLNYK